MNVVRRLVLTSAVAATAAPGAVAASASANEPAASIRASVVAGQQLPGPDRGRYLMDVEVTVKADCRLGCDLTAELAMSGHPVVIDHRSFGPERTHRYTVRTRGTLGGYFGDTLRLIRRTSTGDRQLAKFDSYGQLLAEPTADEQDVTASGDWRRELDVAATETMTLRSATRGSWVSGPISGRAGQLGVIAETGPSGGVLGVYVAGALKATVDLRSSVSVKRKVVAVINAPRNDTSVRVVNLTPAGRAAATANFDGLVRLMTWGGGRDGSAREIFAPIDIDVLDQQLSASIPDARVRMRVSARVSGCAAGCRLTWGGKTIASTTSPATATLSALIAPSLDGAPGEVGYVKLYRGSVYLGFAYVAPYRMSLQPYGIPFDDSLAYSRGWTEKTLAGAINSTAHVTTTPGTGMTNRWQFYDSRAQRTVAVVTARGPQMGVMGVYRNGRLIDTIDLRSTTPQPRAVVASVPLGADGRITIANLTPAGRSARTVAVDELLTIGNDED